MKTSKEFLEECKVLSESLAERIIENIEARLEKKELTSESGIRFPNIEIRKQVYSIVADHLKKYGWELDSMLEYANLVVTIRPYEKA